MASARRCRCPRADSMMILQSGAARRRRGTASIPFMRGIRWSITTTSGWSSAARSTPSAPSLASATTRQRSSASTASQSRMRRSGSSSTTRTRTGSPTHSGPATSSSVTSCGIGPPEAIMRVGTRMAAPGFRWAPVTVAPFAPILPRRTTNHGGGGSDPGHHGDPRRPAHDHRLRRTPVRLQPGSDQGRGPVQTAEPGLGGGAGGPRGGAGPRAPGPNRATGPVATRLLEAGVMDAGVTEAGVMEAGVMEAGVMDAGVMEATGRDDPGQNARVGNLDTDTAVVALGEGRYRGRLSQDWEIWGPMGGYVAAVALRAAGAASPFGRPASFFCHYLAVGSFEEVEVEVRTLRSARTACSQSATVTQGDRTLLEATIWSVGEVDGLEHHEVEPPEVPGPDQLKAVEELVPDAPPGFPFWSNFESRPVAFDPDWPPSGPVPPVWQQWCRLRAPETLEDPWLDAARSLVLLDVQSWPAASRHHAWRPPRYIAPSLDLYAAFHEPAPDAVWLLADGYSPVAAEGLIGWHGRLWSPEGRLVASGGGQNLCRRLPSQG